MGLILDTNFIITAEREARTGKRGKADVFLEAHQDESFYITFTIAGELACGDSAAARKTGGACASPTACCHGAWRSPGGMGRFTGN
ncbi:MAG: hypothetical protein ACKVY0_21930 [Prosthecobacter sp.]|uniref:hypothetical protein n=1 Tax=Prosthecobacter sp. TaxID=1965333 RepID=UPI00390396E0